MRERKKDENRGKYNGCKDDGNFKDVTVKQ